jgi:glycosyltransferase involved in cell wall biosynthesis
MQKSDNPVGRFFLGLKSFRGQSKEIGIHYVVDDAPWSIRHDGESIIGPIREQVPEFSGFITVDSRRLRGQVVHFGSLWLFAAHYKRLRKSNRIVLTVFHGHPGLDEDMEKAFATMNQAIPDIEVVVVSNSIMQDRMRKLGVPEVKIRLLPLGVDLRTFAPVSNDERMRRRKALGIPDDRLCIGSFQKDGGGWEEGNSPKLIKGPDVFLDAVEKLSKDHRIFVLLTGPARGYVKNGLDSIGVPYRHDRLENVSLLPPYYHCLDLYMVASREEGGPKSVLESMASGTPLVTTRVGMAADIAVDGENALVVDIEDADGLATAASTILNDPGLAKRLTEHAGKTVSSFDWSDIAMRYYDELYRPLLNPAPLS